MSRLVRRAATAALSLPLAFGAVLASAPAAQASGGVTVPGCYGVGIVICDPTVTYPEPVAVDKYTVIVPVCTGTCEYVKVTLVRVTTTGDPIVACGSFTSLSGQQTEVCTNDIVLQ